MKSYFSNACFTFLFQAFSERSDNLDEDPMLDNAGISARSIFQLNFLLFI
jgi:hypothetical protein